MIAMPHVLIVEDAESTTGTVEIVCRSIDCTVSVASNGFEALSLLAKEPINLVVTDLWLPQMDGLSLAHAMRSNPTYAGIPIVGITEEATDQDLAAMRAGGFSQLIIQPYAISTLRKAISDQLKNMPRKTVTDGYSA
jgi:CheY-like chemotaxis protein